MQIASGHLTSYVFSSWAGCYWKISSDVLLLLLDSSVACACLDKMKPCKLKIYPHGVLPSYVRACRHGLSSLQPQLYRCRILEPSDPSICASAASRWNLAARRLIHPSTPLHTVPSAPFWHLDCFLRRRHQAFSISPRVLPDCLAQKAKLFSQALQLSFRTHMPPDRQLRRRSPPGMPCGKWRGLVEHSLRTRDQFQRHRRMDDVARPFLDKRAYTSRRTSLGVGTRFITRTQFWRRRRAVSGALRAMRPNLQWVHGF